MGYLGEGGNRNPPSPRQFFGDFLSAQKVTRPEAKHPFYAKFSNTNRRADGDIGPYRLSPAGEALFLTQENGDTQLAFLVSTFHPQPWLESLKLYDLACSASDDLGNQYSSDQFYFLNTGGRLRDLCWVLLEDPAPAACRFTFTLDTDRGSVTFTITPEGGENA